MTYVYDLWVFPLLSFQESTKRFILCPAAVSIAVLKKLIQGKYDLKNISCIEIMYRERYLPDDFLLMDIAYKYSWSQVIQMQTREQELKPRLSN